MLSQSLRRMGYTTVVTFALMGAILFIAPQWAAQNFLWQISPFVAMTMGGWYLGHGAMAYFGVQKWDWSRNYGALMTSWGFSLGQSVLLILHPGALVLSAPLAIPYIVMLLVASAYAVMGIVETLRARPRIQPESESQPWWVRGMNVIFVLFVAYLALPLIVGYARGGTVWPGDLTLLTARAFGTFFATLLPGMVVMVLRGTMVPVLTYMRGGWVMVAFILVAAFAFINAFDFVNKPGGYLYIGSYLIAGAASSLLLAREFLRQRQASMATPKAA